MIVTYMDSEVYVHYNGLFTLDLIRRAALQHIRCKITLRQIIPACDDRRRDRQTQDDSIYCVSIASRGNSVCTIALSVSCDKNIVVN